MKGRKPTFDTGKALELLKEDLKYREIAKLLHVKENTLWMFYKRHVGEELQKRRDSRRCKKDSKEVYWYD